MNAADAAAASRALAQLRAAQQQRRWGVELYSPVCRPDHCRAGQTFAFLHCANCGTHDFPFHVFRGTCAWCCMVHYNCPCCTLAIKCAASGRDAGPRPAMSAAEALAGLTPAAAESALGVVNAFRESQRLRPSACGCGGFEQLFVFPNCGNCGFHFPAPTHDVPLTNHKVNRPKCILCCSIHNNCASCLKALEWASAERLAFGVF